MCENCGRLGEAVDDRISTYGECQVSPGRESKMHCPCLAGKNMLSCAALKDVYVPSSYELEEYCKTTMHTMCPRYPSEISSQRR